MVQNSNNKLHNILSTSRLNFTSKGRSSQRRMTQSSEFVRKSLVRSNKNIGIKIEKIDSVEAASP